MKYMRWFGKILIALGILLAGGSAGLFVSLLVYVMVAQPADTSGWGAAVGGSMILAMGAVPAGLLVLLLGVAFSYAGRPNP